MKTFLVPAIIHSFHRRPLLLVYPAAILLLAALAGWLLAPSSSSAQLAPPVDHFKCYQVQDVTPPTPATVTLNDQFESQQVTVQRAVAFCNPVQKTLNTVVTPITNPDSHLTLYQLAQPLPTEPVRTVDVNNQFGLQQLTVTNPLYLAVPTLKQPFGPPHDLDHFKCYQATGPSVSLTVDLRDQFHGEPGVQVMQPEFFCNPTEKIHGTQTFPITNPAVHMVCYRITATTFSTSVNISNQFIAADSLQVFTAQDLCVPSQKLAVNTPTPTPTPGPTSSPTPAPVLDHFKCYPVQGPQAHQPETVTLRDQFNSQDRLVSQVVRFCNPVEKTHNVITPITNPDSHLTWYQLATMTETPRIVQVSNQFGNQQLSVHDAQFLLVPTQKQPFGQPHDLDHFKCYVASGQPINQMVGLRDQFLTEPQVQVMVPNFLCNPVDKLHNSIDYPIMHPNDHLVCYQIAGAPINPMVNSVSQFNPPQSFSVLPADELCVPSQKGAVCTDTDGDGICDSTDNCPNWYNPTQALPAWPIPAGDTDCDGFPNSVPIAPPNALSAETLMGTDPLSHCAATPVRNDEPPPDAWPVDFDDNQTANGSDLLTFAPVFGSISPGPPYDPRWDLNNDGKITGSDLLKFAPFFGKHCAQLLTVNKVCSPATDTGKFNLQIDGVTAGTGANAVCGTGTGLVVVSMGAHTVSETAGIGTNLADYTTVIGGNCAGTGAITLAVGDVKTCTITNTHN